MLHLWTGFFFAPFYLTQQVFFFRVSLDRCHHLERTKLLAENSKDGRSAHNLLENVKMNLSEAKTLLEEEVLLRMWLVGVEDSVVGKGNMNHMDDVHGGVGDSSGLVGSQGLTGGSGTSCLDKVL